MHFFNYLHIGIDKLVPYSMSGKDHLWHHGVHYLVAYVMPGVLMLMFAWWFYRRIANSLMESLKKRGAAPAVDGDPTGPFSKSLFQFIRKYTWREQIWLIGGAVLALPVLYASLELPKNIINNAINSNHFPVALIGAELQQVSFLLLLCGTFLFVIVFHGGLKFAMNLFKGKVAERLLRRFRMLLHRQWRRNRNPGSCAQLIPVLIQEIEPIGGFAGDVIVTPLFQGGTFLTILLFMFMQDPVLGAAAIALLPFQLALIPRLQKKINRLNRERVHNVRSLGSSLEKDAAHSRNDVTLKEIHLLFRTLQAIRINIYRRKFFMKGLNNFLNQLSPFFFYTIGGYLVIDGALSFGALVAVLSAHKDFSAPLKELFRYYQSMEDVKVRYTEVVKFLNDSEPGESSLTSTAPIVAEANDNGKKKHAVVYG